MTVAVRVIACLDVDDGRVVKGVNFVNLRDAGDPVVDRRDVQLQLLEECTFVEMAEEAVPLHRQVGLAGALKGWGDVFYRRAPRGDRRPLDGSRPTPWWPATLPVGAGLPRLEPGRSALVEKDRPPPRGPRAFRPARIW
mgnify:CR=1 FL=1